MAIRKYKPYSKQEQLKHINNFKNRKKELEKDCMELWQELVKAMAGYKCEFPGCRKSAEHYKLDAHHIYSKGTYRHLKFDLDNGISLCVQHHQAGWGKEAAHSDINWKDKILGRIQGYKAVRTEQWLELLNRKAQCNQKTDLQMEKLYLIGGAKKYKDKLPMQFKIKYNI